MLLAKNLDSAKNNSLKSHRIKKKYFQQVLKNPNIFFQIFSDAQSNQNQQIPPRRPQRPQRPQRPGFRLRNPNPRRPNRRPFRNNYNYRYYPKRNPIRNPIIQEANGLSEWLNIKCLFFCALSHADYDTSESFT